MVIDLLPPGAPSTAARAAATTVREYARVVLMGGVGMRGGDVLALPYPWTMRNSITVHGAADGSARRQGRIIRLLASGALDLAPERVRSFPLDAVTHAGPFDRAALTPRTGRRARPAPHRSDGNRWMGGPI
ncbi:hypothetical protein [Streptomyces sp. NPDC056628]|uniref:hypothetical protein n=1 Tax=Streptomyces sp. NPDC056628 TaxID=3345882 RepID=UPI00369E1B44